MTQRHKLREQIRRGNASPGANCRFATDHEASPDAACEEAARRCRSFQALGHRRGLSPFRMIPRIILSAFSARAKAVPGSGARTLHSNGWSSCARPSTGSAMANACDASPFRPCQSPPPAVAALPGEAFRSRLPAFQAPTNRTATACHQILDTSAPRAFSAFLRLSGPKDRSLPPARTGATGFEALHPETELRTRPATTDDCFCSSGRA